MKIQGLAIIFVIIILPITIIIGEYANTQIQTIRLEQLYDSRLITATDDSLKAFQINTFNDAASDIADSKINSIEASANAFYNSMEASFGLNGYSKEHLQNYVPALVFTMYDGYYIYSPYSNVADISGESGLELNLDTEDVDYGFKPYVYYSCRYVKGDIDVIINYSLDNYITVQGTINGKAVYESGYLLTIAESPSDEGVYSTEVDGTAKCYYNGLEIPKEAALEDTLIESDGKTLKKYKYIKLNGMKYYWDETNEYIFHLMNGDRSSQVKKADDVVLYTNYVDKITNNTSAINYYRSAYEFSSWVNTNLGDLTLGDAKTDLGLSGKKTDKIFANENIEYPSSNFHLHRKEVIRYSIESNLSVAIANFNSYTQQSSANFQMPKLKDNEWEMLQNEVSIISFLQGMNIGGKIYNGYSVVTNSKTEEVVKEERIYMTTSDGYYHKINDKHLISDYTPENVILGLLDLDFEIRKDGVTGVSYIRRNELGCYTSIVGQENVDNSYQSIYEYLKETEIDDKIKIKYYTALGRERWGIYKVENPSYIPTILANMELKQPELEPDPEPEPEPEPDPAITASVITAEDYGKYITNYTPKNGSSVGWRIFHSDGNNIYLIADDYIENKYVPVGNVAAITGSGSYAFKFNINNIKNVYTGSDDIKNSIVAQKWLSTYTSAYTSTKDNMKITAYLMDTDEWGTFKDNAGYADYAIGSPTLPLFVASYNVKNSKGIKTYQISANGYYVNWKSASGGVRELQGLETSENLYVIPSTAKATGMWLASPSSKGDDNIVIVKSDASFNYSASTQYFGTRPIICLKSDVKLEKNADGSYRIL